mgnify:CR=1 FL=1
MFGCLSFLFFISLTLKCQEFGNQQKGFGVGGRIILCYSTVEQERKRQGLNGEEFCSFKTVDHFYVIKKKSCKEYDLRKTEKHEREIHKMKTLWTLKTKDEKKIIKWKIWKREVLFYIINEISSLFVLLRFSRSLSRFETQDIKTQPQINHYLNFWGCIWLNVFSLPLPRWCTSLQREAWAR